MHIPLASSTTGASSAAPLPIRGHSETMRMLLLTMAALGYTFTWGVEMTYCTPYLLNLGLSKSSTSLVWIAGPLSGLIVQPIVGALSDESTHPWGRRRPFIMGGSAIVAVSLLVLGFTREIMVDGLGWWASPETGVAGHPKQTSVIVVAVLAIYVVDFAINSVMSASRSLIVDTLPIEKQQAGAAWANRLMSVGNIMAYGSGSLDLVGLLGTTLGTTQFQQLTVLAALFLLLSSGITCWAVEEKVFHQPNQEPGWAKRNEDNPTTTRLVSRPSLERQPSSAAAHNQASSSSSPPPAPKGLFRVVGQIYDTMLHLPPRIQAICWAVFWSWIGWFPFLFYSTTWIGETYFRYDVPPEARSSHDALGEMGRVGSQSLFYYSCITLLGAWVLPMLIRSPDQEEDASRSSAATSSSLHTMHQESGRRASRWTDRKPNLLTAWTWGNVIFASAMFMAPWASSYRFATVLVCMCGFPWAIANWAPVTFLGVEVNRLTGVDLRHADDIELLRPAAGSSSTLLPSMSNPKPSSSSSSAAPSPPRTASVAPPQDAELSGIYFGILNIYNTLPQLLGTLIATIIFAILEPGTSPELHGLPEPEAEEASRTNDGPNAIAVCLFIGSLCTLMAIRMTRQLRKLGM